MQMSSIVPVLIPRECKRVMDFIADGEVRSKLRLRTSYLFARLTSPLPIRAYNALKKVCEACGLNRPQDITSTNLRKYMATLTQVMNLNDSELQQLCRHLGHTTEVHLTHYRTMIPFVERVTLGKALLMQDLNIQSKFVGKTLNDVDFLDIIKDRNSENSIETPESSEAPQPEVEPEPEPENVFQFNEDDDMMDVTDESDQEPARHSTRKEKNKKETKTKMVRK